jgi:hypothetical protein
VHDGFGSAIWFVGQAYERWPEVPPEVLAASRPTMPTRPTPQSSTRPISRRSRPISSSSRSRAASRSSTGPLASSRVEIWTGRRDSRDNPRAPSTGRRDSQDNPRAPSMGRREYRDQLCAPSTGRRDLGALRMPAADRW